MDTRLDLFADSDDFFLSLEKEKIRKMKKRRCIKNNADKLRDDKAFDSDN